MKAVIVAAMLMACAVATTEQDRLFSEFKSAHGRKYASEEEEQKRFRIFSDNMNTAAEMSRLNPHAIFGANEFADISAAEFKSRHNSARYYSSNEFKSLPMMSFTDAEVKVAEVTKIDWRAHGAVTAVKNQGQCGSCWAFSTTGGIEGQWALSGHKLTPLSEQELVSCDHTDSGCNGGLMSRALDYLINYRRGHIVTEASYPYTSGGGIPSSCSANVDSKAIGATIAGIHAVEDNEEAMAVFVGSKGPLSIGVDASSWQTYTGGIMTNCQGGQIDHGVLLVGYDYQPGKTSDKSYWIIKNSWGSSWGEAGYIRVRMFHRECSIGTPTSSLVKHA